MSSLLRSWLEEEGLTWNHQEKLEDVFANGYMIGQLLAHLHVGGLTVATFEKEFGDSFAIEKIAHNYELVTQSLMDGGVIVKPKLLQDIAQRIPGAIHRFIYDLKCFIDRKNRESLGQTVPIAALSPDNHAPPLSPIGSPSRKRKETFETMQLHDIQNKVRQVATDTYNERAELYLKKFYDHADFLQHEAERAADIEKEIQLEKQSQHRAILLDRMHNQQAVKQNIHQTGEENWKTNQRAKVEREKEKLRYELSQARKNAKEIHKKHKQLSGETEQSLSEFETILARYNETKQSEANAAAEEPTTEPNPEATEAEKPQNAGPASTGDNFVDALAHIDHLKKRLPDERALRSENEKYLHAIKERVAKERLARKERERRRKKLLADELALNESEHLNASQQIVEELSKPPPQIQEFKASVQKIKAHGKIFESKQAIVQQKELERKRRNKAVALQRDQQHFNSTQSDNTLMQTQEMAKMREYQQRRAAHQHRKNVKFCNGVAHSIVELSHKSTLYRKLSASENVPKQLWNEWLHQMFPALAEPTDLPEESTENETDMPSESADVEKEASAVDELSQQLVEESATHTAIVQIQNALSEAVDIDSDKNRELINNTEITQYLRAKGIWRYPKQELSEEDLAAIQQYDSNANPEPTDEKASTEHDTNEEQPPKADLPSLVGPLPWDTQDNQPNEAIPDKEEPSVHQLGDILQEIIAISEGPDPAHIPTIPEVPVTIAFTGKPFSGKTTQIQKLVKKYALQVLDLQTVIQQAVAAFEQVSPDDAEAELTSQQQIGKQLKEILSSGNEVDIDLSIEALFDAINSSTNDEKTNGWILDGFPADVSAAELLEEKLTGYVDPSRKKKGKGKAKVSKAKPSKVAPGKNKKSSDDSLVSGLDFVICLDIPTPEEPESPKEQPEEAEEPQEPADPHAILIQRARGRLVDPETGRVFHMDSNPPPADETIKERLSAPNDEEYVASLPQYFEQYNQTKPELISWFERFANWYELDATKGIDETHTSLCEMIGAKIEEKIQKRDAEKAAEEEAVANEPKPEAPAEDAPENEEATEDNPEEEQPPPEPKAQDNLFTIADYPMCQRLHSLWANVEEAYIGALKNSFNLMRHERRRILAYCASTRHYFYGFLRRPDNKQSLIDEFQKHFNQIPVDMRSDIETKDELHKRSDELNFQLFEYSMQRKNEALDEIKAIESSIWLTQQQKTLSNIFIGLLQSEVNRYIGTTQLIKDYFQIKRNQILDEQTLPVFNLREELSKNKKGGKKGKGGDVNPSLEIVNSAIEVCQAKNNEVFTAVQTNTKDESELYRSEELQLYKDENERLSLRIDRIQELCKLQCANVESQRSHLLTNLDKWVGLRIASENEAIESLIEHIQSIIENESALHYRLCLEGENFQIDKDIIVHPLPAPLIAPLTLHTPPQDVFTVSQLQWLIGLLSEQASIGIIDLTEIINIISQNNKSGHLPQNWNGYDSSQLTKLLQPFTIGIVTNNEFVNWKLFVVSLILQSLETVLQKSTLPSLDTLIELQKAFKAVSSQNNHVNKESFNSIQLWFDCHLSDNENGSNPWKALLFDLFSDNNDSNEVVCDSNTLLYHLCFNDSHCNGITKLTMLINDAKAFTEDSYSITNEQFQTIYFRGLSINDVLTDIPIFEEMSISDVCQNDAFTVCFDSIQN